MNHHDILWLNLAREIAKLDPPPVLPWESDNVHVLNAWSLICKPSEIPHLEERLQSNPNPKAELVTKEALRIAKHKLPQGIDDDSTGHH